MIRKGASPTGRRWWVWFAFRGIIGAFEAGYGPYYVIMHANMGIWIQQHGHWFRPGTSAIGNNEIVGYCLREDMEAARSRRRGTGH
jgi:hypothetical protein